VAPATSAIFEDDAILNICDQNHYLNDNTASVDIFNGFATEEDFEPKIKVKKSALSRQQKTVKSEDNSQ
jgi:hypothetical protein